MDVSVLSGVSPALAEALRASRGHMVKEEPQQGGRHQLDSGQRRTLLGEDALQGGVLGGRQISILINQINQINQTSISQILTDFFLFLLPVLILDLDQVPVQ